MIDNSRWSEIVALLALISLQYPVIFISINKTASLLAFNIKIILLLFSITNLNENNNRLINTWVYITWSINITFSLILMTCNFVFTFIISPEINRMVWFNNSFVSISTNDSVSDRLKRNNDWQTKFIRSTCGTTCSANVRWNSLLCHSFSIFVTPSTNVFNGPSSSFPILTAILLIIANRLLCFICLNNSFAFWTFVITVTVQYFEFNNKR